MTRRNLKRKLTYTFVFLGVVLLLAAVARFSFPLQESGSLAFIGWSAVYDYLKDMSLLIATGGVAYLTNVYQKRSSFIDSLKEEWRDVLHAKSALLEFTHTEQPTQQHYVATFNVLSETIDNMRTVYRNVGETKDLIGLYPFAPLHDMRRMLQTLNPAKVSNVSEEQRKQVRDAIVQAFYALREVFLDELDLEEPSRPLLIIAGRRTKASGAPRWAKSWQDRQTKRQAKSATPDAAIDALHQELYEKEQSTPKAWREVAADKGAA
jgi:hypothetical protein